MADEWPKVALEHVADLSGGYAFKSEEYSPYGRFVLRTLNIGDRGRINRDQAVYIPLNGCAPYERFELRVNDILFVMVGATLGKIGLVTARDLPALLNQNLWRIRAIDKAVDQRFLFYSFKHYAALGLAGASGSARQFVRRDDYRRLAVPLPPIKIQRAIASILGVLDDKIELNLRMNETLEAMARAIFKDWFCRCGDNFTRSRVSDLIANATMAIGDGYRAKNNEFGVPGLPFIRAGELDEGFDIQKAEVLHERSVLAAREKVSRVADVAFTSKGTIGRFARVSMQTPKFVYSPQVCFWRSTDNTRLRSAILYAWMVSDDLKNQIGAVAGQTDMAPYVSLRDQKAMMMPVFGAGQHSIADIIDKLLERQDINVAESRTLSATGDLLLPKLMSGEIQLRDAEKVLDAVA
jgi:type I restriction enzyme S subunit